MAAILLALSASLAWGFADFGAGVGSRRLPVFVVAVVMQSAGFVVAGLAVAVTGESFPSWRQVAWAAFAGLVGVGGLAAFYRGLAVGSMGIVGPISTTAAIVPLAYGLARGERPSTLQALGVALAVLGVAGASLEHVPETATRRIGAGVGLALLAAAGFGCSLIGLSRAAPGGIVWAVWIMRVVAVPCMLVLALAFGVRRPSRRMWPLLVGVGIGDTGATLLALPTRYIRQLGLLKTRERPSISAHGAGTINIYEPVRLTILERFCAVEVMEVPDEVPPLIGQIPLETLDLVIDLCGQRLTGNPAHGGIETLELY